MSELYKPIVPKWVAEILDHEKNKGHLPFKHYPSGQLRKDWNDWKYRYSRKLKYAKLNGWIVEED